MLGKGFISLVNPSPKMVSDFILTLLNSHLWKSAVTVALKCTILSAKGHCRPYSGIAPIGVNILLKVNGSVQRNHDVHGLA